MCGEYINVYMCSYNVKFDEADKQQQVGWYTVADIYCTGCKDKLGCKYVSANTIVLILIYYYQIFC